jgi:hypothetical protein
MNPGQNSVAGLPNNRGASRRELMTQLGKIRTLLREHGIRDAPDYAEVLVAEALDGVRVASKVNQGHDVIAPSYGRVEVKCRQLPSDGRVEERVAVSASKLRGFDYLAIVIFHLDFTPKGATMVHYDAVWDLVVNQSYNRVSFAQAACLAGAIDITDKVRLASSK